MPEFTLIDDLSKVDPKHWDALTDDEPFLKHAFLHALQHHGCASRATGWQSLHLVMHEKSTLCGALPLYLKHHSRGEYVFDMAWARAFEQNGISYYPKLVSAVPFTPVPGSRLLARKPTHKQALAQEAIKLCAQNGISSLHILFPDQQDIGILQQAGFMMRSNVQFHWINKDYSTLNEFLACMSQAKRKKVRQDSRKVQQAGICFTTHSGLEFTNELLDFFYECYRQTYLEHGQPPYLNAAFFNGLAKTMPENLVLIVAHQNGQPIASALNIRSKTRLYGRYWGSLRFVPGLHFETCYLQGIAYCINEGLHAFEGGAQGEHKLSRGFSPVRTWSAHWVAHSGYANAIRAFLNAETDAVEEYEILLQEHSPYKAQQ